MVSVTILCVQNVRWGNNLPILRYLFNINFNGTSFVDWENMRSVKTYWDSCKSKDEYLNTFSALFLYSLIIIGVIFF